MKILYQAFKVGLLNSILFGLFFGLLTEEKLMAQMPQYYIGNPNGAPLTSGNYIPFGPLSTSWMKWQGYYAPGELTGAPVNHNITAVWFRAWFSRPPAQYTNFRVSIGHITGTTIPAGFYTPVTDGYFAATHTTGPEVSGWWFKIPLQTPVLYDPTKTLVVQVCYEAFSGTYQAVATSFTAAPLSRRRSYGGPGCAAAYLGGDATRSEFGVDLVPACGIPNDSISVAITDAVGNTITYANAPGTVHARLRLLYPPVGTSNVTLNLEFYKVGGPASPAYTASFTTTKLSGIDLDQTFAVSLPGTLTPGYYRVKPIVNTINSCREYENKVLPEKVLMIIAPGQTPCLVWPGDVNNDDIVNYGDRGALNMYIHNANLRATWLQGPARYRADVATNPMTYLTWEEQPAVPWFTPEGCYMDADGNGFVNNFDYLGIKTNFMRMHGSIAKSGASFSPTTFDMDQNYPNPFNPSTTIRFSSPERSHVRLVIHDMLGREVETLVNDVVVQGVQTVTFDASQYNSGNYVATIHMVGMESGLTFSKTIRMTLNK